MSYADTVDRGWRINWWSLRAPAYDSNILGSEWRALIAELETDIGAQRQWYYAHTVDSLF